jgi:CheY-like chemotaxis protein
MAAVAEAAEMLSISDLDRATGNDLTRAWALVRKSADVTLEELARSIAHDMHLEVADVDDADPRAATLLPGSVAYRTNLLPMSCTDRDITVATANPLGQEARREVAELSGRTVNFVVAPPDDIAAGIATIYGSPADADESEDAPHKPRAPGGPHILVVDDEAGQRALARSLLEEAGFRVDLAKDGPTAVKMLEGDATYALVTLDYWMDRMNGLRVLQHIRSHPTASDMPIIMVTGADDRQIEMSLFEAGADDYIAKPIDGPLFVLRVRAVLRRRRLARA